MQRAHKRKIKVLVVDAAMMFAAVQMTVCMHVLLVFLRVMEESRTEKWQGERCRNGIRRSKAVPIP